MNFSQRGSAYLSVLLVILITGILGVSLLTFALTNFKTSLGFFYSNDTFYKTDSIIAAAQIQIEKEVRIGQEKAKEYAMENRASIIELATSFDEETGISTFDEDFFKAKYEEFFCDSFNRYMCEDNEENGKKAILGLKDAIPEISSIVMQSYDEIVDYKEDLFITIQATKNRNDNTKTITAKFKLLREPAISIKKVVSKLRNPIWMRAVTAEGDVIAVGGAVNINSNESTDNKYKKSDAVYAWGTNKYRTTGTNSLGNSYGGIIAGVNQSIIDGLGLSKFGLTSGAGNINIFGETFTDSYIHTFGNNSSISIDVDDGKNEALETFGTDMTIPKVFAESVQTEEFSNLNNITIMGDSIVKDDLEINSSNSTINITGNFLGISSGPNSDYGNDKYANRSSSIAYNDVFEDSQINVGKYIVVSGVAYNDNVTYDVDPYKGTPYKTGESLGIGENHKIYRYYFDGEDISQTFDNNFKLSIEGEKLDYPLFSGKTGAPPNGVGNNRVERFKKYLVNYYEKDQYLDYQPNLGSNDLINIGFNNSNKIEGYSLGVLPANGKLYMPITLTSADKGSEAFVQGLLKDFDFLYSSDIFNTLKEAWEDRYNRETWLSNKSGTRKAESEFASLVDYSVNFETDRVNSDNSIILKTSNGDLNIDMSALNGKGGLVFAKGNIIISGSTDGIFKGSIVAGGSVVFKGNGEKTITYNEKNVLEAIKLNADVRAFFSKGGISEVDSDSVEIELKSQKNVMIEDYREIK